jgi:hypothetical protein
MPNAEDIIRRANGMKVFSKLDLKSAFEQFLLASKSRHISRFRTHRGIYQFKRLFFGVCAAPEIFHNKIRKILEGLKQVENATDDILVMGVDIEDNERQLEELFKLLEKEGLTVNKDKCLFNQSEVTFFGFRISADGVSLNEQKTKALKEASVPNNVSELHSFLGLSVYASRWIKDLAIIAEPLWNLTKNDVRWHWIETHQKSFDLIRSTLVDKVGFFDTNWDTILTVDASPVGLGAILRQEDPNNTKESKVIMYTSRLLNPFERKYSQIEKEALAIVWACERLQMYLLGKRFKIESDNKAVSLIFNNPLAKPPAVIQRWSLRLSHFDFEVKHRAGKGNISDFLSRHPLKTWDVKDDSESYVNMVVSYSMPQRVSEQMILDAIELDDSLSELREMIRKSHFVANDRTKCYEKVFNELSLTDKGLILRDVRILIPDCLQSSIIDLAHQGHQGISKTIGLLRTKVWFPNLNGKTTERLKKCLACQASISSGAHIAPIQATVRALEPWSSISVDFYGPIYPTNEYVMGIYDDGSKFALAEIVSSVSSEVCCKKLDTIFGIIGIPDEVKSDNATTFTSETFKRFATYLGFKHRLITPLWPRANGGVEAFMRNLGKVIKTAKIDGVCWKMRLNEFMRNYRATPHSMTKVTPAQLIFRNANTSRLPRYKSGFVPESIDIQASANDQVNKKKMVEHANRYLQTKKVSLQVGDRVLVKQNQTNKTISPYDPNPFEITSIKGTMITAKNKNKTITRNISFFKLWRGEMTKDEVSRQESRVVTKESKLNEKLTHESKSVKKFSTVEIVRQDQKFIENDLQLNNELLLDLNIEQSNESPTAELLNDAVVNQSNLFEEELGSPESNWESVLSETSRVSAGETTPARRSERIRTAPTSYREKRQYKKKKKLNSPTQEKRINKKEKKKNKLFVK